MSDTTVIPFPGQHQAADATRQMEQAREEHIAAFTSWLATAHPSRDTAMLEIEVFAATARQLVGLHTKPPRT